jgi:DNA mismatch repair protein MutL
LEQGKAAAVIQRLSNTVIDQIAAGEVVERPASVVKELVENALDADAGRIRLAVREGGTRLVSVTDDGVGMSPEGARLCLERHATSKLVSPDDLLRISSFGFRGEALPAIASVSRMRLRTRPRGVETQGTGYEVRLDHGEIESEGPISAEEGTRVEVADLFGNVPARRKFLKRPQTEWSHIADWIGRLALALPGVHFETRRDDREALIWPATADPLDRIALVLSEKEAASLVAVETEDALGHLQAYVSTPENTRANTGGLYLFVNGRPVRDKLMRQAVLDVYRDWLPRGRFPTAVVFLTVPPAEVDVNVHPAKWEVRFADPRGIHRLLRRSIRDTIASRTWLGGGGTEETSAPAPGPAGVSGWHTPVRSVEAGGWQGPARPGPEPSRAGETTDWIFAARSSEDVVGDSPARPLGAEAPGLRFGDLRCVGQLHASYLLVEGQNGLLLVDQHAAHERIVYERLRSEWGNQKVASQGLLTPLPVPLDPRSLAALREHADVVSQLGFEIEGFGEDAGLLRAVPVLLTDRDPADLVTELARELSAEGVRGELGADASRWFPVVDRLFASLACHAARRAGDHLELEEQQGLLRELDTIPWAPTCPHGRPVAVALDMAEIERRFGRR